MRDWMVKGGIDGFVTTNPRFYKAAEENPILSTKPLRLIEEESRLPATLQELYRTLKG
jgi:hypothetical protein